MSDDLSIPNAGYRGNRTGRYGAGQGRVRQGMDPDTRRLVIFAGGLGAVLAVLIGASSLVGRHGNEVPVVAADGRPLRVKPENPGGMKIDGAENDVFSGGSDTANAKLAPAAEVPNARALRADAVPPAPVAEAPAPIPAIPPTGPVSKALVVTNAPPAPKPTVVATAKPAPVPVPAAAKAAPVAAVAAETHPAPAGHPIVQLAALTSEDGAHTEWQLLNKRMPDLLNGKQPIYTRTDRDGHTYWRVRTGGFADIAQARAFCDHVRAKGGGCSVADF